MTLASLQCAHHVAALSEAALATLLQQVPQWSVQEGKLRRAFALRDYHQTIAFVNALAWMIHQQDHHPELLVSYKECVVSFNTHSVGGGLSENDFICAAKADALYQQREQKAGA
jgi:4a-hydroxytetrahydrobiopterin dehydratase